MTKYVGVTEGFANLTNFERSPKLAELKVSYRRDRKRTHDKERSPIILNSCTRSEEYLRAIWDQDTIELREEFLLICLNNALEVLGWVKLHTGGFNHSSVDPRLLLGVALRTASSGIVVAHNHPSGSPTPSAEDFALTRRLAEACNMVGLRFVDHVIITPSTSYSFSSNGDF